MTEILRQNPPYVFEKDAELELINLEVLKTAFEQRWGEYRTARTIIKNQKGRTIYEVYEIDLFYKSLNDIAPILRDFGIESSILGYHSVINSLIVPENIENPEGYLSAMVFFFLELIESEA